MEQKMTVGLIDDHRALTDALTLLLESDGTMKVTQVAYNYNDGMDLINAKCCDVVVIDMNLGKEDSCDLIKVAKQNGITSIVLSAYTDLALIKRAIRSGARGYIAKSSAAKFIKEGIESVAQGQIYYDDTIQAQINSFISQEPVLQIVKERAIPSRLTPREKEVLKLVQIGMTSKEIGEELCLSKLTIDGYRKRLISKWVVLSR